MKKILQYIFFIPVGILYGAFLGGAMKFVGSFFSMANPQLDFIIDAFTWFIVGSSFCFGFFIGSFNVFPIHNNKTRIICLALLGVIGAICVIWQILNQMYYGSVFFSFGAIFTISIILKMQLDEIIIT